MSNKYKYLSKNVIIFAISSFGTKFLSFFLVPLYTNILSTTEYGVADIITTTATLMIYIFTINISDSVLRFAIERNEKQDEILSFGVRVLTIGSLVLILSLTIIYQLHFVEWNVYYYVFIFLYFISTAFYQMITNYLRAIDQITDVAIAGILSALVLILGNFLFLVVIKIGIYGYLISLILGPLVGAIYCFIKIKVAFAVYKKNICDRMIQKAMIKYCVPLIFNNIALWINAFLDKYFVTAICGVEQNGIYAVSYKIPMILSTCYLVFSQAWNLSAIKEFDREDNDGFFTKTYSVYNAVIVIICSALILINIPIAKILFAKEFFPAWNYSSVLLLSVMFNALTSFLGSVFTAVKNSKIIAITTLISAGINVILNSLLIPAIGVQGATIATAVSYFVMWIIRLLISRKYIRIKINIVRDLFLYLLLVLQVVIEHFEGHYYIGQVIIFMIIVILNFSYIRIIIKQVMKKVHQKRKVL